MARPQKRVVIQKLPSGQIQITQHANIGRRHQVRTFSPSNADKGIAWAEDMRKRGYVIHDHR